MYNKPLHPIISSYSLKIHDINPFNDIWAMALTNFHPMSFFPTLS